MNKRNLFIALAGFTLSACTALPAANKPPVSDAQKVFLVRHAEKGAGSNPNLTQVGAERAIALGDKLRRMNITTIYHTPYNRTRQTAELAAARAGANLREYNASDLKSFASIVRGSRENILIVGHSNTTPELARLLGMTAPSIREDEYNNLFLVELDKGAFKRGSVLTIK